MLQAQYILDTYQLSKLLQLPDTNPHCDSLLSLQQCALKKTLSLITIETTAPSVFTSLHFVTLHSSYSSYK